MRTDPYIHRKELAQKLHISSESVRRNERRLRINDARDTYCRHPVRYRRNHPAIQRLLQEEDES